MARRSTIKVEDAFACWMFERFSGYVRLPGGLNHLGEVNCPTSKGAIMSSSLGSDNTALPTGLSVLICVGYAGAYAGTKRIR